MCAHITSPLTEAVGRRSNGFGLGNRAGVWEDPWWGRPMRYVTKWVNKTRFVILCPPPQLTSSIPSPSTASSPRYFDAHPHSSWHIEHGQHGSCSSVNTAPAAPAFADSIAASSSAFADPIPTVSSAFADAIVAPTSSAASTTINAIDTGAPPSPRHLFNIINAFDGGPLPHPLNGHRRVWPTTASSSWASTCLT